jgi:hypothetical protein
MFRPIVASAKIRNGIMIELRKKSLPKSGIGDERNQQNEDDPDLVLQDRQDRLIRLVGRLELSTSR